MVLLEQDALEFEPQPCRYIACLEGAALLQSGDGAGVSTTSTAPSCLYVPHQKPAHILSSRNTQGLFNWHRCLPRLPISMMAVALDSNRVTVSAAKVDGE